MTRTDAKTHDIETALRTLDAAPPIDHLDDDSRGAARARADLDRILTSDLPGSLAVPDRRTGQRTGPRTGRRIVLAAGLVAAATAGVFVLPSPFGGDRAYASWTAAPAGLSAADSAAAASSCREQQSSDGFADRYPQLAGAAVAVAERRGEWSTVMLTGEDGFSALCITDDSRALFAGDVFGSIGVPDVPVPGPRELSATDLGTGSLDAGELSVAAGFAGDDVTGVVYRSASNGDVTATVNAGRFALWFPGDELLDAVHGVDVDVTYRDGSQAVQTLSLA
ncbi:hypothetical protein [Kineococcus radiotolerans]|uniref:Uncharacterized protein n=1 Tax=Kineococcus radiotolerans (strain ATCC BAA-149 / DSM 14245 / SRS30216) TaxID=266940 RepID=A6WAQ5_KINRD|nr:hypothetical protein [Kineococcus radiotolerans]ABS03894.1 conserved hypothetical protein [Kineococcus radiotolerans SRS30216 = ATCC BAA-149]